MGSLMGRRLSNPGADIIVPVPLHKASSRGYNQSEKLSEGISEEWRIPVIGNALKWNIINGTQTGKNRHGRSAMRLDAMSAEACIAGRRVFLVDDVYTTGATLRSARYAAERAGGVVVGAAVWSRRISSLENQDAWGDAGNG